MILKRLLYVSYYILKTNWKLFFQYIDYTKSKKGVSSFYLYRDILASVFKYNMSPLDYFSFGFFDLSPADRANCLGTGFMYEYQLIMNPPKYREVLSDKALFMEQFNDLGGRKWATLLMLEKDPSFASAFVANAGGKLVIKNSKGQAGKQVKVLDTLNKSKDQIIEMMRSNHYDLAEYFVVQHDDFMSLSPAGLNTVRILTQHLGNRIDIVLSFVRISVNSDVDNLSTDNYGRNFGCPVDLSTGKFDGPGVYLNRMIPNIYEHPVTKIELVGFQIPFWKECIDLVTKAAELTPQNKSVGWDVGVTNNGPVLIEGNHNWNNLSMVLSGKGYKNQLLGYLSALKS